MEAREEIMTKADMEMAAQAHDLALALYRYFTYGEDSKLIKGIEKQQNGIWLCLLIFQEYL